MITIHAKLTEYFHDGFQWIIKYKVEDAQSLQALNIGGDLDYDSIYYTADTIEKPEVFAEIGDNVAITLDLVTCPYTLDVNANFTKVVKHETPQPDKERREMGYWLRNPYGARFNCS